MEVWEQSPILLLTFPGWVWSGPPLDLASMYRVQSWERTSYDHLSDWKWMKWKWKCTISVMCCSYKCFGIHIIIKTFEKKDKFHINSHKTPEIGQTKLLAPSTCTPFGNNNWKQSLPSTKTFVIQLFFWRKQCIFWKDSRGADNFCHDCRF